MRDLVYLAAIVGMVVLGVVAIVYGRRFRAAAGKGRLLIDTAGDDDPARPATLSNGLTLPLSGTIPRIRITVHLFRSGRLRAKEEVDPEELSAEQDAYRNLRASLLGACGGNEDTLILMMSMASGHVSSREIADLTGKHHTTIWRWYQSTLNMMATNLVAAGHPT